MDIDTFVTLISDIPKGTLPRSYPLTAQKEFEKRTVVLRSEYAKLEAQLKAKDTTIKQLTLTTKK